MKNRKYENPIIGDKVTFLKTAGETNGELTLIEVELKAGGGNSLHYHRVFSETFEVIEGTLGVHVGKKYRTLNEGESFTIPPHVLHNFQNDSDKPIKFRVELRPGHSGFEKCVQIGYGLAGDGRTNKKGIPHKLSHLAVILGLGDTNLPGVYTFMTTVLLLMAARARRKGIEAELVNQYCI